jgi:hypothetical protein
MDVRGAGDGGTRRVRNYRLNGSVRPRLVGEMKKKNRLVDEFVGEDLSPGLSAQVYMVKKAESKASWGIICRELGPWLLFVSVPMPYRMVKKPYILATSVVYKPFPRSTILCCTKL